MSCTGTTKPKVSIWFLWFGSGLWVMFWQIQLIPSSPCKLLVMVGEKQKCSQTSKHPGMRLEFKAEQSLEGNASLHPTSSDPLSLWCQNAYLSTSPIFSVHPGVIQAMRLSALSSNTSSLNRVESKNFMYRKLNICWTAQMKTNSSSVSVSRFGYLHQSKERCQESSTLKLKTSLLPSLVGCSTSGLIFWAYFRLFSDFYKCNPWK